jgi:hypothetical protein
VSVLLYRENNISIGVLLSFLEGEIINADEFN